MQVSDGLGFDWGGLLTNVAQAGVQYSTQKSAAKLQLARIVAENKMALESQRAAMAAAMPPPAVLPSYGVGSMPRSGGRAGVPWMPVAVVAAAAVVILLARRGLS